MYVRAQVRTVQDLNARLGKLSATIAAASADSARASSIARLQENKSKLLEDLATESRTLEWHQAVSVHGGWKSLAISQLSLYLAALLRRIQGASPNIWAHVPEMYVECAVCSFHALQRTQTEALMPTTVHVAALLSRLLGDARLVSPNMRDVVLQSVTNLLSSPGTLAAIADDDEVMDLLLPGLMERYTQACLTTRACGVTNARMKALPNTRPQPPEAQHPPAVWSHFCALSETGCVWWRVLYWNQKAARL